MKKKPHTGFRNEKLFCFNCGQSYDMHYPQPIEMATAMMKQFEKTHKNCEPVWKEPVNETAGKSEHANAIWWKYSGEHGMSSQTMFNTFTSHLHIDPFSYGISYPYDPDDFKRCYKLLQAVPQWKERLSELKPLHPVWERLVDNWDKLTEMFEENVRTEWKDYKRIGMAEFMDKLIKK
jgi:hypothetical protein